MSPEALKRLVSRFERAVSAYAMKDGAHYADYKDTVQEYKDAKWALLEAIDKQAK